MDESKKALIAEVQEITGKGKGEQPTEMPLARLVKEVGQVSTGKGRMELGSPAWESITCPRCKSALRYYTSRYYEPPYVRLKCPVCEVDLGVIGAAGGKIEIITAQPWPPVTPPVYTCPHCGATFSTQGELDAHIASVHPPAPPPGAKLIDWLKIYWPHLTVTGLGVVLAVAAIAKYRKKR